MASKKFIYGVAELKYKDFIVGYIEKGSFDMGGTKGEATKIEAEQIPGTPVLVIPQSNGTINPQFNIIQLDYENLQHLLGGFLHYKEGDVEKTTPVGWTAQTSTLQLQGPWEITTVSGKNVLMPNALLLADLGGKLTLTETAKVECSLEPMVPEDGGQPYGIFDSDAVPETWKQYKLPAPPADTADEQTE